MTRPPNGDGQRCTLKWVGRLHLWARDHPDPQQATGCELETELNDERQLEIRNDAPDRRRTKWVRETFRLSLHLIL